MTMWFTLLSTHALPGHSMSKDMRNDLRGLSGLNYGAVMKLADYSHSIPTG